jgi:hypothetical protein
MLDGDIETFISELKCDCLFFCTLIKIEIYLLSIHFPRILFKNPREITECESQSSITKLKQAICYIIALSFISLY